MSSRRGRPDDEGRLIQLVYYAYVGGSAIARLIPERMAYGMARTLGRFAAKRSKRRGTVARNLALITGKHEGSEENEALVRSAFESYATYWLETFRFVREDQDFFLHHVRSDTLDRIAGVQARGKGAIVIVGHLGNWDAAGAWVGATGRRLVTVAEVLRPRRMFEFFSDHRAKLGMTIYPAQKGATEDLIAEVEAGAVVAILGDRDLKGTGIPARFFGVETTFPRGPARVALATGVPLLVAGVYSMVHPDGVRGWRVDISEPIELPSGPDAAEELTQAYVERLEGYVAAVPEQWHVFQPFWPTEGK
ncbi:MAG TPA: phosphatidylinositol mannoside acyltransferase [Actinomycetota bacterium]|nr:phosphatidylinositol mannoside acyltransferase [Actinomycetota bacterium]